jgi:hypothetical protein
MKKKFKLEINTPCDADLNAMEKTNLGFFCSSCTKNVIDLSTKTNSEIAEFIAKNKNNKSICAQLKVSQLEHEFEYNEIDPTKSLKYAVAIAASVLLTTSVVAQEKPTQNTEQNQQDRSSLMVGKIAQVRPQIKFITFTLKGKLVDNSTNKPISQKDYKTITILVNGAQKRAEVNPKTGEFSIPVSIQENATEFNFSIYTEGFYAQKTIIFEKKSIKNQILIQNIKINPKEDFQPYKIAGGLGVIYHNDKKIKSNS